MGILDSIKSAIGGDDKSSSFVEKVEISGVSVSANSDGTINITVKIATNNAVSVEIVNKAGAKLSIKDQNGDLATENSERTSVAVAASAAVDFYTINVTGKNGTAKSQTIGTAYEVAAGVGANKKVGSYVSLKNKMAFMMGDFYDTAAKKLTKESVCAEIDVILDADFTLKSANKAKAAAIAEKAAASVITPGKASVISSVGVAASYSVKKVDELNGVISGILIRNVDVTAVKF